MNTEMQKTSPREEVSGLSDTQLDCFLFLAGTTYQGVLLGFFFPQKTYFLIFRGKLNKISPLPGLVWTAVPITSVIPGIRGLAIPGDSGWRQRGVRSRRQDGTQTDHNVTCL